METKKLLQSKKADLSIDPRSLVFKSMEGVNEFRPQPKLPLPQILRLRFKSQWWIRCVNHDLIEASFCHDSFVDINALNRKDHPCFNCALGKKYRAMFCEDNFEAERKEDLVD